MTNEFTNLLLTGEMVDDGDGDGIFGGAAGLGVFGGVNVNMNMNMNMNANMNANSSGINIGAGINNVGGSGMAFGNDYVGVGVGTW